MTPIQCRFYPTGCTRNNCKYEHKGKAGHFKKIPGCWFEKTKLGCRFGEDCKFKQQQTKTPTNVARGFTEHWLKKEHYENDIQTLKNLLTANTNLLSTTTNLLSTATSDIKTLRTKIRELEQKEQARQLHQRKEPQLNMANTEKNTATDPTSERDESDENDENERNDRKKRRTPDEPKPEPDEINESDESDESEPNEKEEEEGAEEGEEEEEEEEERQAKENEPDSEEEEKEEEEKILKEEEEEKEEKEEQKQQIEKEKEQEQAVRNTNEPTACKQLQQEKKEQNNEPKKPKLLKHFRTTTRRLTDKHRANYACQPNYQGLYLTVFRDTPTDRTFYQSRESPALPKWNFIWRDNDTHEQILPNKMYYPKRNSKWTGAKLEYYDVYSDSENEYEKDHETETFKQFADTLKQRNRDEQEHKGPPYNTRSRYTQKPD